MRGVVPGDGIPPAGLRVESGQAAGARRPQDVSRVSDSAKVKNGLYWYSESVWDFEVLGEVIDNRIRFRQSHASRPIAATDAVLVPATLEDLARNNLGAKREIIDL